MALDVPPDWLDEEPSNDPVRVPPHDLDAERAVLACAMLDDGAVSRASELRPEHFYSEAHRRIYEAIIALASSGRPDIVRVASWLKDHDRLAQVGGTEYLRKDVLHTDLETANVARYAEIVSGHARSRRAIEIGHRLVESGYGGGEPAAIVDRATRDLGEIGAAAQPKPGALTLRPAAEIWAPLEPPDYLVDGVLIRGSLALLAAYGSSLKTWLLQDALLAVATGSPWLGRFATKQVRAALIDFEAGEYEIRRRAQRIARGREYQIPVDGFSYVSMPPVSLVDNAFFDGVRQLAAEHGLIGIDSLAAGSAGVDENDTRFAASLIRLKAIAAETGCVIVVLHHTKKGGGDETDEREMVRGSSAIFNACDVILQMRRADEGAFVVRQTKARGGKAAEPFVVRVEDIGADASVVSARDLDAEDGQAVSKVLAKGKAEILRLLASEHGLRSKDAVYRRMHGTKAVRVEALKEAIEDGTVVVTSDGFFRLSSEVKS